MKCNASRFFIACLLSFSLLLSCRENTGQISPELTDAEKAWLDGHSDELFFAPDPFYAPFEYFDRNSGTTKGLAHEYMDLIEKKLGVPFHTIEVSSFSEILSLARERKVSIVNAVTKTPQRGEYLLFTKPFVEIRNVILVRSTDRRDLTLGDLRGKTVSVVDGYGVTEFLKGTHPEMVFQPVATDLNAILNVAYGMSDAAIVDLATATYLTKVEGITNIRVAGDAGYSIRLAIGTRSDWPELHSIISKTLDSISIDERERIYRKWVRLESVDFFRSQQFKILILIIIVLSGTTGMILLWNKQLKKKIASGTLHLSNALDDLRESETALRNSNARMRTLVQTIPDLIWLKDANGVYLSCNTMFERFFGATEEEIVGKTDYDFTDTVQADSFREHDRMAMAAGKPSHNEEWITFADDGRKALLDTIKTPMFDETGNLIGILGIGRDITERKEAENDIKKLLGEKELLLREVHHRIKNNMNTIKGLLNMQVSAAKNESVASSIRDAECRVQSMIMLYERLYCTDNYHELSVKDYLESLVSEITGSFPNRGIVRVDTDIDDFTLNIAILTPLGIIINELLTNMMKYAFTGRATGVIHIAARREGKTVVIIVADDGVGLPESVSFKKSTGFGLGLVNLLVEQIGGDISVERNNGTRYRLTFDRLD